MNDLISIIVPIYNVENYLDRCLDSIVNQTYTNLEIILVDDGSTDNSKLMCDDYKNKDHRIVVIHKKNGGLSSARNVGIDIAHGNYIMFVDSDDFIDIKMVENMLKILKETNSDISICNRFYYYENGDKKLRYKNNNIQIIMNSEQAIYEMNNYRNFDMSAWCKLYKIELFNDIRFPNGKISEDFYIMYLLFDKAKKIVYNSNPYYYYFQRNGSITKTASLKYDFVNAAYEQMKYVEKKYPNLKACMHVAYMSANMTIYNMLLKSGGKCEKEELLILRNNVRKHYSYIKEYVEFPFLRRIETFLFISCIPLYNFLFKCLRKVKKV